MLTQQQLFYLLYTTSDVQIHWLLNSIFFIHNSKVTMNWNAGRGIELSFDLANTAYVDFHDKDSANVYYDRSIMCGRATRTGASGGSSMNIVE